MTKPVRVFEDLEVFKRAYRVSLEVHKATLHFPMIEQYALGDQIRRASKSICANIGEGFGKQRQSRAEFRRFLVMAMGSDSENAAGPFDEAEKLVRSRLFFLIPDP